jgi:hypothetical protein
MRITASWFGSLWPTEYKDVGTILRVTNTRAPLDFVIPTTRKWRRARPRSHQRAVVLGCVKAKPVIAKRCSASTCGR